MLAVVEILRMHLGAAQLFGGGEDGGVVVADLVSITQLERGLKKFQGRLQGGEGPPLAAKSQGFFVGEGQLPRRSGRDIELLQNLK